MVHVLSTQMVNILIYQAANQNVNQDITVKMVHVNQTQMENTVI
jgi:hypothetical protein